MNRLRSHHRKLLNQKNTRCLVLFDYFDKRFDQSEANNTQKSFSDDVCHFVCVWYSCTPSSHTLIQDIFIVNKNHLFFFKVYNLYSQSNIKSSTYAFTLYVSVVPQYLTYSGVQSVKTLRYNNTTKCSLNS